VEKNEQTVVNVHLEEDDKTYPIVIGFKTIQHHLADYLKNQIEKRPARVLVVTDENVERAGHLARVVSCIKRAKLEVHAVAIAPGESSKCIDSWMELSKKLSDESFTRDDLVIALGGGVVGDLAGFAASTYMRGIRLIQIPTSLLAMVDSSVGGKVAIDLGFKKNLLGSFWQPIAVFVDLDFLKTLPEEWWRDGFGECLKCMLLKDSTSKILRHDTPEDLVKKMMRDPEFLFKTVKACIELKREVVEYDQHEDIDFGCFQRKILNFGHTLGHALEKVTEFKLSHGRAVLLGILGACGYAVESKLGHLEPEDLARARELVKLCYGEKKFNEDTAMLVMLGKGREALEAKILDALRFDKKIGRRGKLEIVLPWAILRGQQFPEIDPKQAREKFIAPALRAIFRSSSTPDKQ